MDISITGKQMSVGEAFREHVENRLTDATEKYFSRSIDANVTASKNGHLFRVDCSLHARSGINMQSHGEHKDVYGAFDEAADRIEKQLRRYKRRLKNHHNDSAKALEALSAQSYVLAPEEEDEAAELKDQPVIIAETRTNIPTVSVGDAVMLMDLTHANALMFKNGASGDLNMVYRRSDGNIGWIDPAANKG
ncbi:MAG: ribosome-associated translation inhibitor RaiA [Sphingomonadales bacterium]|nr:ribosome-associated translation inhibitor RaiA [Sphingomonadales bacterium]